MSLPVDPKVQVQEGGKEEEFRVRLEGTVPGSAYRWTARLLPGGVIAQSPQSPEGYFHCRPGQEAAGWGAGWGGARDICGVLPSSGPGLERRKVCRPEAQ